MKVQIQGKEGIKRRGGGGALGKRAFRYDSTCLIVVHVQLLHTQIIVAQAIAL